jgi:hypothetical protein
VRKPTASIAAAKNKRRRLALAAEVGTFRHDDPLCECLVVFGGTHDDACFLSAKQVELNQAEAS